MASPQAEYTENKDKNEDVDDNKKILFRFCSECSNLLFPREDKAENKLLFACRTCSFAEEAPSSCVMRHDIASTTGDTAGVTADIGQDPTVGVLARSLSLASLDHFELPASLCTMCGQDIVCEECGEQSAPGFVLEANEDPTGGAFAGT